MRVFTVLILILLCGSIRPVMGLELILAAEAPEAISLTSQEMKRLANGEVLLRSSELSDEGGSAVVIALLDTKPETFWYLLGDCEANFRFVAGLMECKVTESTPGHAVTRQVVKRHWFTPRLEYRFATRREPYQWIRVNLLDGDLELMQGSWLLQESDSGLLVRHEILVKPKMPAPRWLMRRTVSRDSVSMMTCLRAVAGASLNTKGLAEDLQTCPDPP